MLVIDLEGGKGGEVAGDPLGYLKPGRCVYASQESSLALKASAIPAHENTIIVEIQPPTRGGFWVGLI